MKIHAIIQVRTGSTRLPSKVLLKLNNVSLFEFQMNQLRYSKLLDNIVIATTTNKNDDIIEELVEQIIIYKSIFEKINNLILNFDKLFLMSILSFRLKEGLIGNTWPFDKNNINNYIISNNIVNNQLKLILTFPNVLLADAVLVSAFAPLSD